MTTKKTKKYTVVIGRVVIVVVVEVEVSVRLSFSSRRLTPYAALLSIHRSIPSKTARKWYWPALNTQYTHS